jgi:hypothetical protein
MIFPNGALKPCPHGEGMVICGTPSCSTCYYEELMSSKDRARNVQLELVYDESKHRNVVRKKKNVLHG